MYHVSGSRKLHKIDTDLFVSHVSSCNFLPRQLLYVYIDFHEPGNGQVFMAHVVYIDFLKILNSVIFWHVYTFLWLWKHLEVHLGNGNVIYALNHF